MNNNMIENTGESEEIFDQETGIKNGRGSRFLRGTLVFMIAVSFMVFVYLLLYFCENTGA